MIKYLIHFRSLTLICLYLGGRGRGGRGRAEREGGRGGGRSSGFHLSVPIMESVLSPLSIWQQINRNKANVMMYAFFFFFPPCLSDPAAICCCISCVIKMTSPQSNLQHTVVICLKEHTSDHKSSILYSTASFPQIYRLMDAYFSSFRVAFVSHSFPEKPKQAERWNTAENIKFLLL